MPEKRRIVNRKKRGNTVSNYLSAIGRFRRERAECMTCAAQGHPLSLTHAQIIFRHLDIRARDLGVARWLGCVAHAHPAADAVPGRRLGNGRQCRYVSLADYDRLLHSHHALSSTLGGG